MIRSAYAFGYSLVELFKRAQFRVDAGLSPTFEELNCSFGHGHSPGARLSYRRLLLSGKSRPSKIQTETLPQATSAYPQFPDISLNPPLGKQRAHPRRGPAHSRQNIAKLPVLGRQGRWSAPRGRRR
jgi:hypothetical protein